MVLAAVNLIQMPRELSIGVHLLLADSIHRGLAAHSSGLVRAACALLDLRNFCILCL